MKNQKGFILPIIIIVVVIAVLGTAGYFAYKQYSAPKPVACTQEAKVCPDGSSVGRTGPNCEFAQCPDQTANWQTYTNSEYGFEIKYPESSQCRFSEIDKGVFAFGRIELNVTDSKELDLNDYVDSFINDNNLAVDIRQNINIANRGGVKLTYRFGGTNRYGEVNFIKNNENIHAIGFTAGGFTCDEPQIFDQILSTFKFTK